MQQKVLVTGFGPFDGKNRNMSEEAVKTLKSITEDIEKKYGVDIVTEILPVEYRETEERLMDLWKTLKPFAVIHVGESPLNFALEKRAKKSGYVRKDNLKECPFDGVCPSSGADEISTALNVDLIQPKLKQVCNVSDNAGRYLCEFVYYISLTHDSNRAIFFHVPHDGIEVNDVAQEIKIVITEVLEQLSTTIK